MLLVALSLLVSFTVRADDLTQLEGKWSLQKTNSDGQAITQTLEIKKDTFVFQMKRGGDQAFYAKGQLKLDKAGPLHIVKFTAIQGGESADDLDALNDDRTSIYVLDDDTWTIASNFDKDRDNEKPSLDLYTRSPK